MAKNILGKPLPDNQTYRQHTEDMHVSQFSSYNNESVLELAEKDNFFQNLQQEKEHEKNRQNHEQQQLRKKLVNHEILQDLQEEIKLEIEQYSVCLSQYDRDMLPAVMHQYIDVGVSSREIKELSETEKYIAKKVHDFYILLHHVYGTNGPYTTLGLCGFAQEMILDQSKKDKSYSVFPLDNHEYYDMEEGDDNVAAHGFTIMRHVSGDIFIVDPTFKQFNVKEITEELGDQESNPVYRLLQLSRGREIAAGLLQDGYIKADEQILQTYFTAMGAGKLKVYKTYTDYFDALPKISWYKQDMNFKKVHKPMKLLQKIEEFLKKI